MKRLLQAVFNEPISVNACAHIEALGFDGVRIDAQKVTSFKQMRDLLDPVLSAGLWPLVIVADGNTCLWLPRGTAIEIRNEPDIEGPSPQSYRQLLIGMREIEKAFGLELWGGCISNLIDRGFTYLRAIADVLPDRVSVHWYPRRPWLYSSGHEGLTRGDEVELLRSIIGGRKFGVSEFGYHTAPVCRGWWFWKRCQALTDDQAAQSIKAEWGFWDAYGADFACLYQLNDGPLNVPLDRYGIRRLDGTFKPQAFTLR